MSPGDYLSSLSLTNRSQIESMNAPGIDRLRDLLAHGSAIAFVGAGASRPLYPLWVDLIGELVDAASGVLSESEARTCRHLARTDPDAVVDLIRQKLRPEIYRDVLQDLFHVRRDSQGRTWTATHELLVRWNLRGVVTTNYDPGIVDARMRARPSASSTGFSTWTDELGLDAWRSADIFADVDLPVLYAHGFHSHPDSIVLATTEYRRAYAGKLGRALGHLMSSGHLIWIGFGFTDQRVSAIMREVADSYGTYDAPGMTPRHVALLPWDARANRGAKANDPGVLRELCALQYGAHAVLYPADGGDHFALQALMSGLTDARFPPVAIDGTSAIRIGARSSLVPAQGALRRSRWVHGGEPPAYFAGRSEDLQRLSRWAADPGVRLIGVTAWGGAGKTALVTEWLSNRDGASARTACRGLFAWSFYENPSVEAWANGLLSWADEAFGVPLGSMRLASAVLALLRKVPLVLVLDGLEVLQEGPDGTDFGRFIGDGLLREILTTLCQSTHGGLAVLTSRFPFADLDRFIGSSARMLDVGALSVVEGATLLAEVGGGWLSEADRQAFVELVDGHALAVTVLAGALADEPPTDDLLQLRRDLEAASQTNERVQRVLSFYARRLQSHDRAIVAITSLFQRPVDPADLLIIGSSDSLGVELDAWTVSDVEAAVQQRLTGVLTLHPDGTISAHPLIRDSFRPLALTAGSVEIVSAVTLDDVPEGNAITVDQAGRIVEMMELFLHAGQWRIAEQLFTTRLAGGEVLRSVGGPALGYRATAALVGVQDREPFLSAVAFGRVLLLAAGFASELGNHTHAEALCERSVKQARAATSINFEGAVELVVIALGNQAEILAQLGYGDRAAAAAREALLLARGERLPDPQGEHGGPLKTHLVAVQTASPRARTLALMRIAWLGLVLGNTLEAEEAFHDVARFDGARCEERYQLSWRAWAAELLIRTNRSDGARILANLCLRTSRRMGWNDGIARAEWLVGWCDVHAQNERAAGRRLSSASRIFRDGGHDEHLAVVRLTQATHARQAGNPVAAALACREVIEYAGLRGNFDLHAGALVIRGQLRSDHCEKSGNTSGFEDAEDDATNAVRLASRARNLPWRHLQALELLARLDEIQSTDRGSSKRAVALREKLIPEDLDATPAYVVRS